MNRGDEPYSQNVAHNIIGSYYVSTALWATLITNAGGIVPTYETFIWEWDNTKKERGKMLKQFYHNTLKQSLNFHFRFCRTLAFRRFKAKLPEDVPFK